MSRMLLFFCLWLIWMLIDEAESGGHVSVTFKRYRNPTHRKWTGKCCDMKWWGRCRGCDTYFRICLTLSTQPRSMRSCSLANIKTSRMGHDDIQMSLNIKRAFFSFTGKVGLYLEAWDWDRFTADDLVDKMSVTLPVHLPDPNGRPVATYRRTLRGRRATMEVIFRVHCFPNYYGPQCTKRCTPRNNHYAHYSCDNGGGKVCHTGWFGSECNKKCIEYGNYQCDSSGNRACRKGWYGRGCNTHCVSYDDDRRGHYVCSSKGNKICRTDWYGTECKRYCFPQDDDVHGHYSCTSDGRKRCRHKWFGSSCMKYCSPGRHANCDTDGNKVCHYGWSGEDCGKFCVAHDDDAHGHYRCDKNGGKICLPNWAPPDCKTCQQGRHPPDCQPRCSPQSSAQHGHYTCDKNDGKTCLMWWYNDDCKTHCIPHDDQTNGHYTCDSMGRAKCLPSWHGANCTEPCLPTDFDFYDQCLQENQTCKPGSTQSDCQQCKPGAYGMNCTLSCLNGAQNTGHIICSESGKKMCAKWWYGSECDVYCVPHDDGFHGHYICDRNGRKRCLLGWQIPECKLKSKPTL